MQAPAPPANTHQIPDRLRTSLHSQFCPQESRGKHEVTDVLLSRYTRSNELTHSYIHSLFFFFFFSIQAHCSFTPLPSSSVQPVPNSLNKGRYGQSSLLNTMCSLLDTAYHMTSAGSWCPAQTSRGSSWKPVLSTLMYPTGVEKLSFLSVLLKLFVGKKNFMSVFYCFFSTSEHDGPKFQPGKWDYRNCGTGVLASSR